LLCEPWVQTKTARLKLQQVKGHRQPLSRGGEPDGQNCPLNFPPPTLDWRGMPKKSVSQPKKLRGEAQVLLDDRGMATVDEAHLRPLHKFVHFWVLVRKSCVRNRSLVPASALAYTTLLALIPLLAVGLGVSTTLLNSSREKTSELIGNLIDQVGPQLGMLPASEQSKGDERTEL